MAFNTLRGREDFSHVLGRGQARRSNGVVLHWAANGLNENRYAVAAKTTTGKSVVRNRIRRWGRELFRRWNGEIALGHDLVVIAQTREAAECYQHFARHLWRALDKAKLVDARSVEPCA